jgi:hypothetical protein
MPTAVLIDGAYFLRRFSSTFPNLSPDKPSSVALGVITLAAYHIAVRIGPSQTLAAMETWRFRPEESEHLYRIFFYDCALWTGRCLAGLQKTGQPDHPWRQKL